MIQKKCTSYSHAMKSYEQFMFCYYACCGKIETATAGTAALKPLVKRLIHRARKLQCFERFSADETEMEPMILEVWEIGQGSVQRFDLSAGRPMCIGGMLVFNATTLS